MSQLGPSYNLAKFYDDVETFAYIYKFWLVVEGQVRRERDEWDAFMKDRTLPYWVEIQNTRSWLDMQELFRRVHETHGGHLGSVTWLLDGERNLVIYCQHEKVASLFALLS